MPFDSAEITTLITEIYGLPESGRAIINTSLSHRPPSLSNTFEPTYATGNFSNLITVIKDQVALANENQVLQVRALLTRWSAITSYKPMSINTGTSGEQGTIIDYDREREGIRTAVANTLGVACPIGGFLADAQRSYAIPLKNNGVCLGDR